MASSPRGGFEASDSLLDGGNAQKPVTPPPGGETKPSRPKRSGGGGRKRLALWGLVALVLLVPAYYLVGGALISRIDDNLSFAPPTQPGGKLSVAMAAGLMERESVTHPWMANTQAFQPGYLLDNMPNYQLGIRDTVLRFVLVLQNQLARSGRGTSEMDQDVSSAFASFSNDPSHFLFPSYESRIRDGVEALRRYNTRLGQGQTSFEIRGDNLQQVLDQFSQKLGAQSATVERYVTPELQGTGPSPIAPSRGSGTAATPPQTAAAASAEAVTATAPLSVSGTPLDGRGGSFFNPDADDVFYVTKGQLYATAMLLDALGKDAEAELRQRGAWEVWQEAVATAKAGAELQPWVVLNGAPDSQFIPSHLAAEGFFLMRTRAKLREAYDILLR